MLKEGHLLDGKYQVIKVLGQGGMGTVYLCKNIRLEKLWAIKEIKSDMDLTAEPNILKNLKHTGIPNIIDIFCEEDNLYIVEDYIEGNTLENIVKASKSLSKDKLSKYALALCDIITYLHSFKPPVIYRDMKPSNIIITPEDKVVLIDFGISRLYKEDKNSDTIYMGSRGYAAPEQYGMGQSGIQTDIYGLGAVIYFMASGRAPLNITEPFKDESYINADAELKKIIEKCMQINPELRYSSVDMLKSELESYMRYDDNTKIMYSKTMVIKPNKHRKKSKIPLVAALVIFIAALALLLLNKNKLLPAPDNSPSAVNSGNKKTNSAEEASKDTSIDGVIYKDSPIINDIAGNSNKKEKGKGRHNDKNPHKPEPHPSSLLYKVSPAAEMIKYDGRLIIKINSVEFNANSAIAICSIENNTGSNLNIMDVGLYNEDDECSQMDTSNSTDLSNIPAGEALQNVILTFNDFNIDTGSSIMLKAASKLDGGSQSSINLNISIR